MIWGFDRDGEATYVSPEWCALTGQSRYDAEGWGWLDPVHPGDRDTLRTTIEAAARDEVDFTVIFRLRRNQDGYLWVVAGAMPSFSTQDATFIGFLGSVSEASKPEDGRSEGWVGHFHPLPPTPGTLPASPLEEIADHLLIARALAAERGEEMLQGLIEVSLLETGQRLARSQRDGHTGPGDSDTAH